MSQQPNLPPPTHQKQSTNSSVSVEVSVDDPDDAAGAEVCDSSHWKRNLRIRAGAGAGTSPKVPPTGPFPGGALVLVVFSAAD